MLEQQKLQNQATTISVTQVTL